MRNAWNVLGWLLVAFLAFVFLGALLESSGTREVTCTGNAYTVDCVTR